ncbi:MAG: fibronectin type III domain-containing protein, partial [Streptosporangiaceae bacterium]
MRDISLVVPDRPFVTSVVAEGLGLLVSWNPDPASEQVASYTVTAAAASGGVTSPPGCSGPFTLSVDGSNSAGLVGGLCTGVAYQATVSATNASGTSAASPLSDPVVPLAAQVPQAPLITSVFGRDGGLLVSWTPPGSNGGKPLTRYTLAASVGGKKVTAHPKASATQATLSGLADGTSYTLALTASNAVGASAAATGSGTPQTAYPPAGPGQVTASPDGTGSVTVSWVAPADNGGDPVTGYTITWQQVVPASSGSGWMPAPGSSPQSTSAGASATSISLS